MVDTFGIVRVFFWVADVSVHSTDQVVNAREVEELEHAGVPLYAVNLAVGLSLSMPNLAADIAKGALFLAVECSQCLYTVHMHTGLATQCCWFPTQPASIYTYTPSSGCRFLLTTSEEKFTQCCPHPRIYSVVFAMRRLRWYGSLVWMTDARDVEKFIYLFMDRLNDVVCLHQAYWATCRSARCLSLEFGESFQSLSVLHHITYD